MKKIIVMASILLGCGVGVNAQKVLDQQTVKSGDLKTQKKGTATKQAAELKNTSANTAIAPLFLPVPRLAADTSFLPVVKKEE